MDIEIFYAGAERYVQFGGAEGVMDSLRIYQGRNREAFGHRKIIHPPTQPKRENMSQILAGTSLS